MITNTKFTQTTPNPTSPRNNPSVAGEVAALNGELGNFEDSAFEGYITEGAVVAYLSSNSFSIVGNRVAYYTQGRFLRLNSATTPVYVQVASASSYNGTITTVTVKTTTVPNPLNTVDFAIQPHGNTDIVTSVHSHTGGNDGTLITKYRSFGFFISGIPSVGQDLSWDPPSPEAMTAIKIWASCQIAPTGTNVILSIYDITKAAVVGAVTIATGALVGNSTTFTTTAIAQGDVLRIDCTQADSNLIGSNYSVLLECTQP